MDEGPEPDLMAFVDGVKIGNDIKTQMGQIDIDMPGTLPDAYTRIKYFWMTAGRAAERMFGPGSDPRAASFLAGLDSVAPKFDDPNGR